MASHLEAVSELEMKNETPSPDDMTLESSSHSEYMYSKLIVSSLRYPPSFIFFLLDCHSLFRNLVLLGVLDLLPELLTSLLVVGKEVVQDKSLRSLTHPLEEGEVTELVGAEDLKHLNGLVANVLDKVAHVAGDDADVTGDVVKGTGGTLGGEDGDTGAAADEEGPLVGVGVPVHLADRAGLDDGVGSSHGLGDGEVLGVSDAHLTTGGLLGLLVQHLVGELVVGLLDVLALGRLVLDGAGHRALEDVLLAGGEVVEELRSEVEVFGDDGLGGVSCVKPAVSIYIIHEKARVVAVASSKNGDIDIPSQSDRIKVDSSEKLPSSKMMRNSVPFSPRPCRE